MKLQPNNNDVISEKVADRLAPGTPEGTEGFISKEVLATRLSKSVRTVENWQRRGIIPYVKCGRVVLFKWTEVQAHLQTHFRSCTSQQPTPTSRQLYHIPCISTGKTERKPKC